MLKLKWGKNVLVYLLLILFGSAFLLPFLWMVGTSLKPDTQLFVFPPKWIPHPFEWSNYHKAVTVINFGLYFKNSLVIAVLATIGTILSSPLAAYSFSRLEWKGRDAFFIGTLGIMMIPTQVTMVPLFISYSHFHLVNTIWPLVLPSFFGIPFYIFLMRQFFKQLPISLEDAGRIDGCSEFQIYWRIMYPLCQPALLTIALFQFMASWNDFIGPLIYLSNEKKYTLQIGLQMFRESNNTDWAPMMAASVIIALPVIILYFFVQKAFIRGISFGGVKG